MFVETVRAEIEGLHEFFIDWFTGSCENSDSVFHERFRDRFSADFLLIPPAGVIVDLAEMTAAIRSGYDGSPGFRIAIRNVTIRQQFEGHLLATYEEWQVNATNSTPPNNGRVATVLMRTDENRPSGLRWLHVHETWLPAEVMAAGPYDF